MVAISKADGANVLQRSSGNDYHSRRGHTPPKNGANFHQLFPYMHMCMPLDDVNSAWLTLWQVERSDAECWAMAS